MPARTTISIGCRVRNFMDREGTSTAAIKKAGNPKPYLMIDGGTQTITIPDKLRLQVHADFPVLCEGISLAEPELVFEWYERTGRLPVAASKYQRKNPRVLRTPAYAEPRVLG